MSTSPLIAIDSKEDRREVWHLLHRLPPADRVHFLVFACRQVPQGKGKLPVPCVQHMQTTLEMAYRCDRADSRLTNECYGDILVLFAQWGLDALATACELVRWVRDPRHRKEQVHRLRLPSGPRPAPETQDSNRAPTRDRSTGGPNVPSGAE